MNIRCILNHTFGIYRLTPKTRDTQKQQYTVAKKYHHNGTLALCTRLSRKPKKKK